MIKVFRLIRMMDARLSHVLPLLQYHTYKGKGIIWELWNEPNGDFWSPHPNVDDYAKLVEVAIPAMRQEDPNVLIVGPRSAISVMRRSWILLQPWGKKEYYSNLMRSLFILIEEPSLKL